MTTHDKPAAPTDAEADCLIEALELYCDHIKSAPGMAKLADRAAAMLRSLLSARRTQAAELARWRDPESDERRFLQEEIIFFLGEGTRSEVELREGQLAQTTAALELARAELEQRTKERDEARRFGEEAADRYNRSLVLRCAFCDEAYPAGTPPTQHEALTAHVKVCEKHPLRAELSALRAELAARDGEDPTRRVHRAKAISEALGIEDQSTTKQCEAISALRTSAAVLQELEAWLPGGRVLSLEHRPSGVGKFRCVLADRGRWVAGVGAPSAIAAITAALQAARQEKSAEEFDALAARSEERQSAEAVTTSEPVPVKGRRPEPPTGGASADPSSPAQPDAARAEMVERASEWLDERGWEFETGGERREMEQELVKFALSETASLRARLAEKDAEIGRLRKELEQAREEREKYRYSAVQFCGAHIGTAMYGCPACERDDWKRKDGEAVSALRGARAELGKALTAYAETSAAWQEECDRRQAAEAERNELRLGVDEAREHAREARAELARAREQAIEECARICDCRTGELDEVEAGEVWSVAAHKIRSLHRAARTGTEAPDEVAWLIERGHSVGQKPTIWRRDFPLRRGSYNEEWTEDAQQAKRYATRAEAQGVAEAVLPKDSFVITEHIWMAPLVSDVEANKSWRDAAHIARAELARAREQAENGKKLGAQVSEFSDWLNQAAETMDEGIKGPSPASEGSVALTAAMVKLSALIAGQDLEGGPTPEQYLELARSLHRAARLCEDDGCCVKATHICHGESKGLNEPRVLCDEHSKTHRMRGHRVEKLRQPAPDAKEPHCEPGDVMKPSEP